MQKTRQRFFPRCARSVSSWRKILKLSPLSYADNGFLILLTHIEAFPLVLFQLKD